ALCGALAYGAVVRACPRSGGEYRFLSDLLHPFAGYLAGWTSLLVGFSAPIAASALSAGHFARTLWPSVSAVPFAAALVVSLTALHAAGFRTSTRTQNGLVALKSALLCGFVAVGLAHAPAGWPAWEPPRPAPDVAPVFATSLLFVSFAFSGWNAAVYAASEFERPRRDVPRAMLLGCLLVAVLYLAVNWVFVASLTPDQASVALTFETDLVTLGHVTMRNALGPAGGAAMSVLTIAALVSSMSAMVFVGPRVYAAMARDGFLPAALRGRGDAPPLPAIVLQGALALLILLTHPLQEMLQNLGAVLTLFAALTAGALFKVRWSRPDLERPSAVALLAAGLFVASSLVLLAFGVQASWRLATWLGLALVLASAGFHLARRERRA
ncbi:MAG TPA: amino acid permease, partial [Vicinamibacteria bacterium]|nr:amino acid permease [Vicinamibacteria bacterium]